MYLTRDIQEPNSDTSTHFPSRKNPRFHPSYTLRGGHGRIAFWLPVLFRRHANTHYRAAPQRMERGLQEQDRLTTTDARSVADALEQAAAPNTRRAYAGAWAAFTAWASGSGYPVLPASQETLAAYLGKLADQGRKLATLRLHRAAVVKAHRLAGHPSPDGELVAAVIKGLGRQFGEPQKQSQTLTNTALAAVRATGPRFPGAPGEGIWRRRPRRRGGGDGRCHHHHHA